MTDDDAGAKRPKFPHLENLDRLLVDRPDYLLRPVTVTEKVHGFNARLGRDADGVLWYGGRNMHWDLDDPLGDPLSGLRDYVQEFVREVEGAIDPGVTIYGEWAGKGVQKGIDYGEKRLYVFAERVGGGPVLSSRAVLDRYWPLGLTAVPVIYEGLARLDVLAELRQAGSVVAHGQPNEGVVVAPVEPVFARGHQVIGKYKAPAFEEVARGPQRERVDLTGDPVWVAAHDFAGTYATPMRLVHVLDQVSEILRASGDGLLADALDVKHTGTVLRAMNEDVLREGSADYDALPPDVRKLVGKAVNFESKRLLDEARLEAAREAAEGAAA